MYNNSTLSMLNMVLKKAYDDDDTTILKSEI